VFRAAPYAAVLVVATALAACSGAGSPGTSEELSTRVGAPSELARVAVPAGETPPAWAYEGDAGPEHWGELAEDWALCAQGTSQSPIDLATAVRHRPGSGRAAAGAVAPGEERIELQYHASSYSVVDNGHTVEVRLDDAGAMVIDGVPFRLEQFHFHTPGEHTLAGTAYPAEYHLEHRSEDGGLAVLAVLVQRGGVNRALAPVLDLLPRTGRTIAGRGLIDPTALLPVNLTMVRYDGSLAHPPCTEGVRWHVLLTPQQLSPSQLGALEARHEGNARPVQPSNGRTVVAEIDRSGGVAA
jgi:carbonic anhydrase